MILIGLAYCTNHIRQLHLRPYHAYVKIFQGIQLELINLGNSEEL